MCKQTQKYYSRKGHCLHNVIFMSNNDLVWIVQVEHWIAWTVTCICAIIFCVRVTFVLCVNMDWLFNGQGRRMPNRNSVISYQLVLFISFRLMRNLMTYIMILYTSFLLVALLVWFIPILETPIWECNNSMIHIKYLVSV